MKREDRGEAEVKGQREESIDFLEAERLDVAGANVLRCTLVCGLTFSRGSRIIESEEEVIR
jgi:hypothetical protein